MESEYPVVSFAQEKKCEQIESRFRNVQALAIIILMVTFVVSFLFDFFNLSLFLCVSQMQIYLVILGIDLASYNDHTAKLFFVFVLDFLALIFIALGIRSIALEILSVACIFTGAFCVISAGHGATFLFRHPGLNVANLVMDLVIALLAFVATWMMYRFKCCVPSGYGNLLDKSGNEEGLAIDATGDAHRATYRAANMDMINQLEKGHK